MAYHFVCYGVVYHLGAAFDVRRTWFPLRAPTFSSRCVCRPCFSWKSRKRRGGDVFLVFVARGCMDENFAGAQVHDSRKNITVGLPMLRDHQLMLIFEVWQACSPQSGSGTTGSVRQSSRRRGSRGAGAGDAESAEKRPTSSSQYSCSILQYPQRVQ